MPTFHAETRVRDVIEQACLEHQSAIVLFLRNPERGRSEFVKIIGHNILMNPVRPISLSSRIHQGEAVVVSFETKGALYWFFSRVTDVSHAIGREFDLRMPRKMTRIQYRSCFRVVPSLSLPVKVRALAGYERPGAVHVENISQKGVAISFPDNPVPLPQKGSMTMELDLGRFGRVKLAADIRSTRYLSSGRYVAGMEFHGTDEQTDSLLSDYLSARQREELKKRTGG